MTLKETFLGTSPLIQQAAAATVVSNFCNWISFTTTSWLIVDSESLRQDWGIWRRCSLSGGQISDCTSLDGVASVWFGTFQAFAMLGFLCVNIAVVLVILFLFVDTFKGNDEVRMAIIITSFAAAACYLISIVFFAVNKSALIPEFEPVHLPASFGHSFGFAIVSFLLEAATGGLLIKDAKDNKEVSSTSQVEESQHAPEAPEPERHTSAEV